MPDTEDIDLADPHTAESIRDAPTAVIVDSTGDPAVPAHQQATLLATMADVSDLVICPGIQSVGSAVWSRYSSGHPGIVKRVEAGQLAQVKELPRRVPDLVDLIHRTWSDQGLVVLESHENSIRPECPRYGVLVALATQRRRLAKRAPKTPPK